ncbi:MAG: pilus assembly protein N-terminal domain-containing protein [Deltaproteobacteria bacterium]|nr:pilus assembly protein N-terminal domain-containing protein [Deltaproteobacteria bacterium]
MSVKSIAYPIALLTLLLICVDNSRARRLDEIQLTFEVGEQEVISSDGVQSYSEGTPGIIDVRLTKDGSQFVLVGRQPGVTTLLFIMMNGDEQHYRIVVSDSQSRSKRDVLREEQPGRVVPRDNIRLDFYFVQLSTAYRHQIGLGWPGAVSGGQFSASFDLMSGSLTEATAVVTDQALPRLDIAQSNGWAKLLRQAAVITVNGGEATFSGGGEVNVPIQGALTSGVNKIEFGSHIKIQPRYDRESSRIELAIHADVSDLSDDSGTGVPGRITSTLDTKVNLELGQSLVLAGLTSRSQTRNQTGLSFFSQIPIIGILFGSNAVRNQESENLVFILPTVVDAVSMKARGRVAEALAIYRDFSGDLGEVRLVDPPKQQAKQNSESLRP